MKISLIGMSGSGKSHWSKKLLANGFTVFDIDALIEEKLGAELNKLGYSGIHDVAKWMGQPYESQYSEASRKYLHFENKIIREILNDLQSGKHDSEDIIIDTTGSVIYTQILILNKLKKLTTVVYLETPQSVQKEMYEAYIKHPKPVIWGNSFIKKNGETNKEALKRCYADLLAFRTVQYKKLADKTFSYHELRDPNFTVAKFIEVLDQ